MATEARAAGRPQAAEDIARRILELADAVVRRRHENIGSGTVASARDVDKVPQAS
jgi:hypothetical protein